MGLGFGGGSSALKVAPSKSTLSRFTRGNLGASTVTAVAASSINPAAVDEYHRRYRGWLANAAVPEVFARHLATVHVPRRFYTEQLPGIPTIRVFEALACGIPLLCSPWTDAENLFRPGEDYLCVPDGRAMAAQMEALIADEPSGQDHNGDRQYYYSHETSLFRPDVNSQF